MPESWTNSFHGAVYNHIARVQYKRSPPPKKKIQHALSCGRPLSDSPSPLPPHSPFAVELGVRPGTCLPSGRLPLQVLNLRPDLLPRQAPPISEHDHLPCPNKANPRNIYHINPQSECKYPLPCEESFVQTRLI